MFYQYSGIFKEHEGGNRVGQTKGQADKEKRKN